MILGYLVCKGTKSIQCTMCALPYATRVRITYEHAVKEWVQYAMYGMVHEPVAHACFVNVAGLGVADAKVVVRTMVVCTAAQVSMQDEDIVHQFVLKFLHIFFLSLPADKFLPRREQILD